MYFFSIFNIADKLQRFIDDSMVDMGRRPRISSIELMLWRMSKTEIGSEMIDTYLRAQKDPSQWREMTALILQGLSPMLNTVKRCTQKASECTYGQTDLKDDINSAANACLNRGYKDVASLFKYITECRHAIIHSGVLPYEITFRNDERIGLKDFLSIDLSQASEDGKFEALCNLILAAFCFYFDALKPNYSKYSLMRQAALRVCMATFNISKAIAMTITGVFISVWVAMKGGCLLFVVGGILVVVLLALSTLKSCTNPPRQSITEVESDHLVELISDMTPYQQMMFMRDRKSALNASGLYHAVGDEALSPADRRTDELYEVFKSYPDPETHYLSKLPNHGRLSRQPVIGWLYERQWGGEKMFTKRKEGKAPIKVDYLPIYQGDYYPVYEISRNGQPLYSNHSLDDITDSLAKYQQLDIMLLYSTGIPDDAKIYADVAEQMKQYLTKRGISSKRISILADPTERGQVTLTVGNVPYYSGSHPR